MGTRGVFGVRIDGVDKAGYTHWGGHPDNLGVSMVDQAGKIMKDLELWKQRARDMVLVSSEGEPTAEQIQKWSEFTDLGVSKQMDQDWYCLMRGAQDDLLVHLELGEIDDAISFIKDSLSCEFGCLINLDEMTIEMYEGFQGSPHAKGRYAEESDAPSSDCGSNKYYACQLVGTFPLDNIPPDWQSQCKFGSEEDEDEVETGTDVGPTSQGERPSA